MKKILLSFFIILLNTFVGAQSKLVTKWNPYTKSYETTYHEDIYEKRQREIEEEEKEEKRRRQKSYEESEKSYNETLNKYIDYQKQKAYEQQMEYLNIINKNQENNLIEENKKNKNCINQTEVYYSSFSNYPTKIIDGWHIVFSTNNSDFCSRRKVLVSNNKIIKYVIDDIKNRTVEYTLPIVNCKTTLKLKESDDYLTVYFLDAIQNSNLNATPPLKTGKKSFWTSLKNGGDIEIFINGIFEGKINTFFESNPNCGQNGTFTYENIPGSYQYEAKNGLYRWSGSFTIYEENCTLLKLTN